MGGVGKLGLGAVAAPHPAPNPDDPAKKGRKSTA